MITKAQPRRSPLARRVRALRRSAGLTLQDVSRQSGISASTVSKIENDQLSPTYDNIIRLAKGLAVDITHLFTDGVASRPTGRRSITRKGEGIRHVTDNYHYEMLCADIARKRIVPLTATIRANSREDFGPLISHDGEEVIYVLRGKVELHTDHYAPVVLEPGDCIYFDSTMGHACIARGLDDAEVFWVCSSEESVQSFLGERSKPTVVGD